MKCIIDAMGNSKYLTLGIWGRPAIFYPVQCGLESKLFSQVIVVTKDPYIEYLIQDIFEDSVQVLSEYPENGLFIEGVAVNISIYTLKRILSTIVGKETIRLADCNLSEEESTFIIDNNSFELSLILHQKRQKPYRLRQKVLNRVSEKTESFQKGVKTDEICLIGH